MKTDQRQFLARVAVFLIVVAPAATFACSFCSSVTARTMLTELDAADIAFVAELKVPTPIRSNPTAYDLLNRDRQKGEAGFLVRHVLRGRPTEAVGSDIIVPLRVPGPARTLHLITCRSTANTWASFRVSVESLSFVEGAAALRIPPWAKPKIADACRRIPFCLRYLDTKDFLLRKAVFAELSRSPYTALQQIRPLINREMVPQWMTLASKRSDEARQVFLLLSVCGDETDVPMLKTEFEQCVDANWSGTLDAVILAYVALGGTEALDHVDRYLLSAPDRSVQLKEAAINSLRFLAAHDFRIGRPRLFCSFRLLLRDPKTEGLVVEDLAKWEYWPMAN